MRALFAMWLCGCAAAWRWEPVESLPRPKAADYPDAPAVVVVDEVRYQIVIPDRAAAWSTAMRHQLIAILSEAGFKYASMSIPLNEDQSLRYLKARTIAPDGTVREVTPEEVLEESARGDAKHHHKQTRQLKFRFPGVQVGGLIEYAYMLESPNVYWWLRWRIGEELPVVRHHSEIFLEGRIESSVKTYLLSQGFREKADGEETLLTLDVRDLPGSRVELLSPPWELVEPWWAFRVRGYHRYRLDRTIYNRWSDVMQLLAEKLYFESDKYFKGAQLKLPAECGHDRRCALDQALAFVRARTALSGFVSSLGDARPVKEVLAEGAANNFEKTLLLRGVLSVLGVESYYALAGRSASLFFDHDFPLPGQFDHMVLYVPVQPGVAEVLFLDPSCEACAAGQVPGWLEGREAMVLQADDSLLLGTRVRTTFMQVKGAAAPANYQRRQLEATLDATGNLSGTLVIERHGQEAVDRRLTTRRWLPEDWRKHRAGELGMRHPTARLDSSTPEECDRTAESCRESLTWTMPAYGAADGTRLVVPMTLLASPWDRAPVDKERHNHVFMHRHAVDEEVARLRIPAGWTVEELPAAATLKSPALEARLEVTAADGVVTIKRTMESHPGLWDRTEYPMVARVLEGASAWRHQTITLQRR
jgi:Domain of Unknown Function with PDB structure (DUF3857)